MKPGSSGTDGVADSLEYIDEHPSGTITSTLLFQTHSSLRALQKEQSTLISKDSIVLPVMQIPTLLHILSIASAPLFCSASPVYCPREVDKPTVTRELPFNLTYLFTAHLNLGAVEKPIAIPGGVRVVEPIINGIVNGPAINATISPSLATPTIGNSSTLQRPVINAFGTTDDGFPFYLYESGIGSNSAQTTRIVSFIRL